MIFLIAASPLLSVAGTGTRTTERRRSRSRSRQKVESKLAQKVDDIPMVHDTIEYLLSTYSLIKVRSFIYFFMIGTLKKSKCKILD